MMKFNKMAMAAFIVCALILFGNTYAYVPNVKVDIQKVYANCNGPLDIGFGKVAVCEDKPLTVDVLVTNHESTSITMNVEMGLYTEQQLRDWNYMSLMSAISVPNCVPTEPYVVTNKVTLAGGASEVVKFTIPKTPTVTLYSTYYITTTAYQKCYSEADGSSLSSFDYVAQIVYPMDGAGRVETCMDGLKNQDETGTDCGGKICKKCANTNLCIIGDDCASGSCTQGRCVTPDDPGDVTCTGFICDLQRQTHMTATTLYLIGAGIVGAFILMLVWIMRPESKGRR